MVLMESVKQQRTLPSELEVSDRTCTYDKIHICMIISYVLYKGPQGPSDLRSQTTVSKVVNTQVVSSNTANGRCI